MNENLESTEYFASPIYVVQLPELVKALNKASDPFIKNAKEKNKKLIKEQEKKFKKKIGDFGMSHHSTSLIDIPEFKTLQTYVGNRSIEILEHMGYDLKDYEILWTEFWVQEFAEKGGGHHEKHIHYNNHISGFYFLKCSEKTSFPVFHDPRPAKIISQLPFKNSNEICLSTDKINYKPMPGTLIMFPAFLEHQFAVDPGIEPFRFIHFNLQAIIKKI